jgi:hypothetical protein
MILIDDVARGGQDRVVKILAHARSCTSADSFLVFMSSEASKVIAEECRDCVSHLLFTIVLLT